MPKRDLEKVGGCLAGLGGGLVILFLAGGLLILVVGLLIGTCV